MMNRTSVDSYLEEGCGRCDHYRTPTCKVHLWHGILEPLRQELLIAGLTEEMKWGSPCYTVAGKNVVMLASFRECCALAFFKGEALSDPAGLLSLPGPNSQQGRLLKFRSVAEFAERRADAAEFVRQAVVVERSGVRLERPTTPSTLPEELEQRLALDPALQGAWDALTPGRRRSHTLHVQGAKQSETRARRVEACVPKILAGLGFQDR